MNEPVHPLCDLFEQLGLESDSKAIEGFIARHAPLPGDVELDKAEFWTPQQARFLFEAVRDDADWAAVVDQLDVQLRLGGD